MRHRHLPTWCCLAVLAAAPLAHAGDGLTVAPDTWPRWQARMALSTMNGADASTRVAAASLLGDYYFSASRLGWAATTGGLRATSGWLLGGPAALGGAGIPLRTDGVSWAHTALPGIAPLQGGDGNGVPYLGLGYTHVAPGGWGVSADLGWVAQNAGGLSGLGRAVLGPQPLDEAVRNLRLMPVVQLGVRYRF